MKAENQTYEDANIIGASATLPDIRDVPVADGRFFTETEEQYRQPVAVIGEDIRTKLFPGSSPIGRTLRPLRHRFHRRRPAWSNRAHRSVRASTIRSTSPSAFTTNCTVAATTGVMFGRGAAEHRPHHGWRARYYARCAAQPLPRAAWRRGQLRRADTGFRAIVYGPDSRRSLLAWWCRLRRFRWWSAAS